MSAIDEDYMVGWTVAVFAIGMFAGAVLGGLTVLMLVH